MQKRTKKIIQGSAIIMVCVLGIMACSSSNPMKKMDKKEVASFLVDASMYAENKLNVKNHENAKGKSYGFCITGNPLAFVNCSDLYSSMMIYAKETQKFKGLSIKHLSDKSFFESIQTEYDIKTYYTI